MKKILFFLLLIFCPLIYFAQDNNQAQVTGNFQVDMQTYKKDTIIGAEEAAEKLLLNSYANINYVNNNFSAGFRYEGYFNTLQGYDSKNDGYGIPYKYAAYTLDGFDVTVGNFYEQFGSGLILRTYEDKNIGYDNAFEGVKIKFSIFKGFYLKALIGKQRYSFSQDTKGFSFLNNKGLIRGLDAEISFNEMFAKLSEVKTQISIGGSFVSKYQKEQTQFIVINDTTYKLEIPENVAAYSGRFNLTHGSIGLSGEYAYKFNDPSADNSYIFKDGNAVLLNATYSIKGLGIYLSAKRIDNMSFRSDRTANLTNLNINYLPDISKNHSYSFAAMYPYATQPNGEIGIQSEISFKIPKETIIGGKYGTSVLINYSRSQSIDKQKIRDDVEIGTMGTNGYKSDFFAIGDEIYYQDINFEISRKISKKFKLIFTYQNLIFNYSLLRGKLDHSGKKYVYANVGIIDISYKITTKHSIRMELQSLITDRDMGDWGMMLLEYTVSPHWFFTVSDQYNYGNHETDLQLHYYGAAFGYVKDATRIQIGYGKQREGVVCVGGVCRAVPASNGFMVSITSSF
jgi:hypothetical protein